MALIPCPDCGTEISDQAKACPKCGRPVPVAKPAQPITYSHTSVVVTIAVVVVGYAVFKGEELELLFRALKRMLGLG